MTSVACRGPRGWGGVPAPGIQPGGHPMFPLSCARARARTAFQPSAHSIFSVLINLNSFHYYFEVIFCPLSQLFSLGSRKTAVSSYIRHPCTMQGRRLYTQWTKV